jgi:hypothetical protein
VDADFAAFVEAWRSMRRWRTAHPDLAAYWETRYRALAAAFGADLELCPAVPPPAPEWVTRRSWDEAGHGWHAPVHRFVVIADERSRSLGSPFDGYIEMPQAIGAAWSRFAPAIDAAVQSLRVAVDTMLVELLAALYPDAAGRVVTADELRAHGFDPDARAPDPLDHL